MTGAMTWSEERVGDVGEDAEPKMVRPCEPRRRLWAMWATLSWIAMPTRLIWYASGSALSKPNVRTASTANTQANQRRVGSRRLRRISSVSSSPYVLQQTRKIAHRL